MAEKEKAIKTIPPEETALFCDQVAMIMKAGIPLRNGIETLCNAHKNTRYADKFQRINDEVQKGGSLYDAIRGVGLFPAYMINMVRVGEYTGTIDEVMESLARYYNREAQIKNSVKNAVLYPALLALMMAVVIAVLTIYVMPVFQRVFASLGADATSATASAMNAGSLVGKIVLAVVGILLLLILVVALLLRSSKRKEVMNALSGLLRPLRRINETMSAARFASISEIMIRSGYNISSTADLALGVIEDKGSVDKLKRLKTDLEAGTPFAQGVVKMGMFEGVHENMIETGSSVGQLDTVMRKLEDMYETKADDGINRAVSLIEPALVAVLSAVVGGILLAVMLPLISILSSMV